MRTWKRYLPIFLFLMALFVWPRSAALHVRHWATSLISHRPEQGVVDLETEHVQCRQLIGQLKAWIADTQSAERDLEQARRLLDKGSDPYFERRGRYLAQLVDLRLRGLPAHVILRQPSSWNSQAWLNVGSKTNRQIGAKVVEVGSPVVCGKIAVGIVEEVLPTRCRIRLVTDQSLNLSVRCVRGAMQDAALMEACCDLGRMLETREEWEGAHALARALYAFSNQLDPLSRSAYLAKGILHGRGESMIGKQGVLIGEGFQYDFTDEEGSQRQLCTGSGAGTAPLPLIAVGDLLVTTGFDGLFPPDLHVGIVTHVHPLVEGGCAYGIEAKALAPHLHQIKFVTVLPAF